MTAIRKDSPLLRSLAAVCVVLALLVLSDLANRCMLEETLPNYRHSGPQKAVL